MTNSDYSPLSVPRLSASTGTTNSASVSGMYDCNVITRTVGATAYTLTYDAENRLTGVSGGVAATFVYDGDGNRVKATIAGTTTAYIGNYYELTGAAYKKYYYAGSSRVALSDNGTLKWLLGDHLGSTSITANGTTGALLTELRYKPWGENRYTSGTTPTTYRFTGQRQESALGGADGLYFYGARWYDPYLSRWLQPDSIVPEPGNPQDLNRFAYTRNNPLRYIDPSGHYTEEAIRDYLILTYGEELGLGYLGLWKNDTEWWSMLRDAQSGDYLYGGEGNQGGFVYQFLGGPGEDGKLLGTLKLSGRSSYSLAELQLGSTSGIIKDGYMRRPEWLGTIRPKSTGYEFRNSRYSERVYAATEAQRTLVRGLRGAAVSGAAGGAGTLMGAFIGGPAGAFVGWGIGTIAGGVDGAFGDPTPIYDALDIEPGDIIVEVGPARFVLQDSNRVIESFTYRPGAVNAWPFK